MSEKTHADTVFVTRDSDLGPFDLKINEFPGLIVEHFSVTVAFGDPIAAAVFEISCGKTDKRRRKPYFAITVGVGSFTSKMVVKLIGIHVRFAV